ncbi:MAG TPA: hypothetical protein VKU88_10335 [Acidimicrobiales bacterium]|nr:hypothetical protein [Acidimicrobiales bacterium]
MADRVPVLAVGSNAAPRQLAEKYRGTHGVVVVTRCKVFGLELAYAPFVASWGYVPLVGQHRRGALADLSICWLDRDQLVRMVADERDGGAATGPEAAASVSGYELVLLDGDRLPVVLHDSGERLWGVTMFRPSGGMAVEPYPWPEPPAATPRAGAAQPPREAARAVVLDEAWRHQPFQQDALGRGWGKPGTAELGGDGLEEVILGPVTQLDSSLAEGVRSAWVALDDVAGLSDPLTSSTAVLARGESHDERLGPVFEVAATGSVDRRGEHVVVLTPDAASALCWHGDGRGVSRDALPRHLLVMAADDEGGFRGVVARVVTADEALDKQRRRVSLPAAGIAALDQTLRCAIGVDVREHVRLAPVSAHPRRIADRIFGPPRYVVARVVRGEYGTGESDLCCLPRLVLDALGVASGDDVVVEGRPPLVAGDGGMNLEAPVPSVELRAVELPPDLAERRRVLAGGGRSGWLGSAEEILGVGTDLPEIVLDADARSRLNVGLLDPVRVRAQRASQVTVELREGIYLLGLSLFVVVSLLYNMAVHRWADVGFLAALVVPAALMAGAARHRLRARFSVHLPHRVAGWRGAGQARRGQVS